MDSNTRQFTMGELVARTNVPSGTIRHYLTLGILPPPIRESANRFLYDERHIEAIRLARLLQERKGLSLEAIGRLLPDLLPDVLGKPAAGVFHPEMWNEVIATRSQMIVGPSVAERLLEAGIAEFGRMGYAQVTVDEICHAAAIAKGSFYRHYRTKEELFFAVSRAAANRSIAEFLEATVDNREPEFAFQQLVTAVGPYLSIFLILSSQASRQRNEYLEELKAVADLINVAANAQVDGINEGKDDLFVQSLAAATQRLIDWPLQPELAAVETLRQIAN